MEKQKELEKEAATIAKCKICKINKIGKPVPGEGNPSAKIMLIGEAPGRKESETGRPFIGRSGQLLTKLLAEIDLSREDVYITSPVKYYPVQRAPTKDEIAHGLIHLKRQIKIINPKIIVLLGKVAARAVLAEDVNIRDNHGKFTEFNKHNVVVTYHPAAALRFPNLTRYIREDLLKLKIFLSDNINI